MKIENTCKSHATSEQDGSGLTLGLAPLNIVSSVE